MIAPINLHKTIESTEMRIQNGPVYVSMFKALGAIPVVIAAAETYT